MTEWTPERSDHARRRAVCRRAARFTTVAVVAVLALGAPDVLGQQAEEPPPAQGAPPQQGVPPQQGAPPQQGTPQGGAAPPDVEMTERQFEDWMVRCGRPGGQGPEVCEMQQQQVDNEERTVMAVAVGHVPGTPDLGLLILLPLGILLPAGVTMQIDGGAEIPLEVERCERQGCRIERVIEPDLLNRLKGGTKATVFFEAVDPQGKRQRLGVPISLLGFTAALNDITS
jgi:invasion protein IalB